MMCSDVNEPNGNQANKRDKQTRAGANPLERASEFIQEEAISFSGTTVGYLKSNKASFALELTA